MELPGFAAGFRVPARFAMLMTLALSAAAALAFARVTRDTRPRVRAALAGVFAAGILADGWIALLPVLDPPAAWRWPAGAPPDAAVLELPIGDDMGEIAALWRSLYHQRPVVNGYSGYEPVHHRVLRLALEQQDYSVLAALRPHGPILVVVDRRTEVSNVIRAALARAQLAMPIGTDADREFFVMPYRVAAATDAGGERLTIARARTNFGVFPLETLTDGDARTRWLTPGPQRGDEEIVLELERASRVARLVLSVGAIADDFPRRLRVDTSPDGEHWNERRELETGEAAMTGFLNDAADGRLSLPVPPGEAKFVRLRQLASSTDYWSIAGIEIFGSVQ
jgi:hypothetical protein